MLPFAQFGLLFPFFSFSLRRESELIPDTIQETINGELVQNEAKAEAIVLTRTIDKAQNYQQSFFKSQTWEFSRKTMWFALS